MKRPPLRTTHTFAIMEVSQSTYDEIRAKLLEADYDHAVWEEGDDGTLLNMSGIALAVTQEPPVLVPPSAPWSEIVGMNMGTTTAIVVAIVTLVSAALFLWWSL